MDESLASIGHSIYGLLDKIDSSGFGTDAHTKDIATLNLIVHEGQRFKVWAVGMGLLVPGHGSLDYRVRDAEGMANTLRLFLNDLTENLEEVLEYRDSPEDSSQPADSSSVDGSDDEADILEIQLDGIKDIIDRLFRLSTKVRNPTTRLRLSKAQRYRVLDGQVDLFEQYTPFDLDYVRSVFQQCRHHLASDRLTQSLHREFLELSTDHYLVQRIAYANVTRRRQFAYWKQHQLKLQQHTDLAVKPLSSLKGTQPYGNSDLRVGALVSEIALPLSISTATQLHSTLLDLNDLSSVTSVSEYMPSPESSNENVIFPPPPRLKASDKFFECPYCFTTCSRRTSKPSAWKAHLIHDLRPYVCTYRNCKTSEQLYDSRLEWANHEASAHGRLWSIATKGRQASSIRIDKTQSSAIGPIRMESPTTSPENSYLDDNGCCPVCIMDHHSEDLQTHLATHLERLALFSMPRSACAVQEGDEQDSDVANAGKENSRASSHHSGLTFNSRPPSISVYSNRSMSQSDVGMSDKNIENQKSWEASKREQMPDHIERIRKEPILLSDDSDSDLDEVAQASKDATPTQQPSEKKDEERENTVHWRPTTASDLKPFMRIATAQRFFDNDNRGRVQNENPNANFAQVHEILIEEWKVLDEQQKSKYQKMADDELARSERNEAGYNVGETGADISDGKEVEKRAESPVFRDRIGRTLLALACTNNDLESVKLRLLERPEYLNLADNAGNTPLQIAALEGFVEIVEFLLKEQCEVDTLNIDRETPLIDAVENGHVEVVKLLLEYGANPRLRNAKGELPYELVPLNDENYKEIRKILAKAMERISAEARESKDGQDTIRGQDRVTENQTAEDLQYRSEASAAIANQSSSNIQDRVQNAGLYLSHSRVAQFMAEPINGEQLEAVFDHVSRIGEIEGHDRAVSLAESIADKCGIELGEDHEYTLIALRHVAMQFVKAGQRQSDALNILERVAEKQKGKLGESHLQTLTTLKCLATLLNSDIGRRDQALLLSERIVELYRSTYGEQHPESIQALVVLALRYRHNGQTKEAVKLAEKVVVLYQTALGDRHPKTIAASHNLAHLYTEVERTEEAVRLLERVVEMYGATLGDMHMNTTTSMSELSSLYHDVGRTEEAVKLAEQVAERRQTTPGDDQPEKISSTNYTVEQGRTLHSESPPATITPPPPQYNYTSGLADYFARLADEPSEPEEPMHQSQMDYPPASDVMTGLPDPRATEVGDELAQVPTSVQETISNSPKGKESEKNDQEIAESASDTRDLQTVLHFQTMFTEGMKFQEAGDFTKARTMCSEALDGIEKALGPEHIITLDTVHRLAQLYHRQDKLDEAERMFERAQTGYEKHPEERPVGILKAKYGLASVYHAQGQVEKAERLYWQVIAGYDEIKQENFDAIRNLGALYHEQGDLTRAERLYAQALAGFENNHGSDYQKTIEARYRLGLVYHGQEKFDEAELALVEALTDSQKTMGTEHPVTLEIYEKLVVWGVY